MGSIPETQSALVGGQNDDIILTQSAPLPDAPRDHEVAVAVKAISLNPVDTKMTGTYHTPGAVLGCDCAGIVTAVGATAAKEWGFCVGDRVVATVVGMNSLRPGIGAFAEHTVCAAWGALKVPTELSFAEAAGGLGGLAWITSSLAIFQAMGVPAGPLLEPLNSRLPPDPTIKPGINMVSNYDGSDRQRTGVLVSGAASYTGTAAVQLLKLAGFTVLATCSPRSFDLVRSFGADEVFDYSSPTVATDIRARTRNGLRLAVDCVTTPDSTQLCYSAIGRSGGRYVALDPYSESETAKRAIVRPAWVFALEPLGEDIAWPPPHNRQSNPLLCEWLQQWNRTMQDLIKRQLLQFHPLDIRDGGFAAALQGLEDIRKKRSGGRKIVYNI